MYSTRGIRRRRLARAAESPAVPHRWTQDVAADLRRQLDNCRRSAAAAVDSDDRRLMLDRVAALARELAEHPAVV